MKPHCTFKDIYLNNNVSVAFKIISLHAKQSYLISYASGTNIFCLGMLTKGYLLCSYSSSTAYWGQHNHLLFNL